MFSSPPAYTTDRKSISISPNTDRSINRECQGIVFTLMIVRVGLGISADGHTASRTVRDISAAKYPDTTEDYFKKPMTFPPELVTMSDIERGY
jgi:hypothetical protein